MLLWQLKHLICYKLYFLLQWYDEEPTQPVFGLQLPHTVRVEEVVEGHAHQLMATVAKVPFATATALLKTISEKQTERHPPKPT